MRTMKNKVMLLVAMMIWLSSCEETQKKAQPKVIGPVSTSKECGNQEKLLYSKDGFSTYTDDKIRGKGVVSFELAANDRLSIYNEDDSEFGYLVLNEDLIALLSLICS